MKKNEELAALLRNNPFRKFLSGFSQQQLIWKPEPGVWSLLEILEHVAVVEANRLRAAATDQTKNEETKAAEVEMIEKALRNRATKVKAPDFLLPQGEIESADAALEEINQVRKEALNWLEDASEQQLAETISPHPILGRMSRAGWIVFVVEHSARHLEQMKELAALEDFPKE